jgi:hypothetical protein
MPDNDVDARGGVTQHDLVLAEILKTSQNDAPGHEEWDLVPRRI